jgi:hypothetical protein
MSQYETDILLWSERQGELLRRRAAGGTVNDTDLDWSNIAEEIGSVGLRELSAVKNSLRLALLNVLKAEAWPLHLSGPIWRADALRCRFDAVDAFAPSMRDRIDVARLYAQALRLMPATIEGQPPLPVPDVCPVTLDDLLSED